MIKASARSFAIVLLLAHPVNGGELNGTLSSRLDFYPENADGTA